MPCQRIFGAGPSAIFSRAARRRGGGKLAGESAEGVAGPGAKPASPASIAPFPKKIERPRFGLLFSATSLQLALRLTVTLPWAPCPRYSRRGAPAPARRSGRGPGALAPLAPGCSCLHGGSYTAVFYRAFLLGVNFC